MDTARVQQVPGMVTTTKTRISSGGQVLLRFDDVPREIPEEALDALALSLPAALRGRTRWCSATTAPAPLPVRCGPPCWNRWQPAPGSLLAVVDAHEPHAWAALKPDLATPNAQEAAGLLGLKLPDGPRAGGRRRGSP